MEACIIALGSNMGDRLSYLHKAVTFCRSLSHPESPEPSCSAIYESEPIGPADAAFLNAAVLIQTPLRPRKLLKRIKEFEASQGRDLNGLRWSNRPIDLDIISYGNQVIQEHDLIIPHTSYRERLFVLLPLRDLQPDWTDPKDGRSLSELLRSAPQLKLHPTTLTW
jgi:2-amino-4-hydroxy-6-hydroxymethyldihydropteridine diphosphokinase